MMIHIDRVIPPSPGPEKPDTLLPCPACGAKAFVRHDVVDGFEFGWSVGCPKYRYNDGVHGHDENTPRELRLTGFNYSSKKQAIEAWNDRVKNGKWTIWPW